MDIEKLLKLLKENNVKYVIIGATAFPYYGYMRATMDVDVFIEPTEENAQKCFKALKEFGDDLSDITIEDLLTKKILIRQYILEIDIHPFVKGISFEEVWKNKVKSKIGDVEVYFASLDDLIKMKKAVNRPKDIQDLKELLKIKEKLEKQK